MVENLKKSFLEKWKMKQIFFWKKVESKTIFFQLKNYL
jgi:hypothetical protein